VNVLSSGTLVVTFNAYSSKVTSITGVQFNIVSGVVSNSVINATSDIPVSQELSLNGVSFTYQSTPMVSLIVITNANNVRFVDVNITRITGSLLWNADFSYLCQVQATVPTLSLNNAKINISSSRFENVNTGMNYIYHAVLYLFF
jgi:uncharacterized protein YjbI with pentapeptide repeats